MNIQYITLKPGSILLTKDYNWFKRTWAKIRGKQLPFNNATLFAEEVDLVNVHGEHSASVVVEPKKVYSAKEIKTLLALVKNATEKKDELDDLMYTYYGSDGDDILFTIVNVVRPNTFESNKLELDAFLNNKYYNVRRLSEEKNWSEYIF